ncbi:putative beta-N-acetylhexosaminidase [Stachybotrys elegans]|uniref:beta-N-acetylhexosaminidase n=1 Tax=Stachybotrys elegans TaxID=80388 RepID=A0A8K0T5E1_9HYPO|nr:putative beta-N-acetylhexosaminidase [Stachybotrys elegans]
MIPQPKAVIDKGGYVAIKSPAPTTSIDDSLPSEAYILDIDASEDGKVHVTGGSAAGVFYGIQTFRQRLPPSLLRRGSSATGPWELPAQQIHDRPRFAWRGVMLDVARHFMPLHDVLRFIDLAAFHKFNVLHLHLTDDQGWRLPIDGWPQLTVVGCWRRRTMQGSAQHELYDKRPHGGFYSRADLEEVVAFASERHMTVVPEIDMPGHMQAAVASYPELGNGAEVGVMEEWGISEHVLNMSDKTLGFCRDVLTTVCDIFPSEFIGIGGDECPHNEWKANPDVQRRMKELGLPDEDALHGWFVTQMASHLRSLGRRAFGWDELLACGDGIPADTRIAGWRGIEPIKMAAQRGFEVIACPDTAAYLDKRQSEDKNEPTPIGTVLTPEDIFAYEPVPAGLSKDEAGKVIGVQANVWTEHMESMRRVEYMAYPRLCAFAEVAWGKSKEDDTVAGFQDRLKHHVLYLDALGVNYRPLTGPRPWDARPDAPGKPRTMEYRMAKQSKFIADLLKH